MLFEMRWPRRHRPIGFTWKKGEEKVPWVCRQRIVTVGPLSARDLLSGQKKVCEVGVSTLWNASRTTVPAGGLRGMSTWNRDRKMLQIRRVGYDVDRVIALIDERGFLRRDAERLLTGDTPDRHEIYKLASRDT